MSPDVLITIAGKDFDRFEGELYGKAEASAIWHEIDRLPAGTVVLGSSVGAPSRAVYSLRVSSAAVLKAQRALLEAVPLDAHGLMEGPEMRIELNGELVHSSFQTIRRPNREDYFCPALTKFPVPIDMLSSNTQVEFVVGEFQQVTISSVTLRIRVA